MNIYTPEHPLQQDLQSRLYCPDVLFPLLPRHICLAQINNWKTGICIICLAQTINWIYFVWPRVIENCRANLECLGKIVLDKINAKVKMFGTDKKGHMEMLWPEVFTWWKGSMAVFIPGEGYSMGIYTLRRWVQGTPGEGESRGIYAYGEGVSRGIYTSREGESRDLHT